MHIRQHKGGVIRNMNTITKDGIRGTNSKRGPLEKLAATLALAALVAGLVPAFATAAPTQQAACQKFDQTGKQVCGRFLEYWTQKGGLAQQGLPLTDVLKEQSPTDGKTYDTQYFERALFEAHPENQ